MAAKHSKPMKCDENVFCNNETNIFGSSLEVMNVFDNLKWDVLDKAHYNECRHKYLLKREKYGVKSNMVALLNSEKVPYPETHIDIPPMPEEEEKPKVFNIPGVEGKSLVLYPELSALTKEEQGILFNFIRKTTSNKCQLRGDKAVLFKRLLEKAQEDYPVFQEFVQAQWRKHHYVRSLQVCPEVMRYIDCLWQRKAANTLNVYPALYKTATNIPLTLNDIYNDHSVMGFIKTVTCRGSPMFLGFFNIKERCTLVSDFKDLCKIKPILPQAMGDVTQVTQTVLPVSMDVTLESLLIKEDVDVVMTSSAVKVIVDKHTPNQEWILPFTLRNVLKNDGKYKKVLFIDKKLPPSAMSVHDKNKWHAKIAARWALILQKLPDILKNKKVCSVQKDDKKVKSIENLSEDFEKFELGNETKMNQNHQTPKTENGETNKDSIESKAVEKNRKVFNATVPCLSPVADRELVSYGEDWLSEDCAVDAKQRSSPCFEHLEGSKTNDKGHAKYNLRKRKSTDSSTTFTTKSPPQRTRHKDIKAKACMAYRLWCLHKSAFHPMSKQEQRPLNILIRNRVDGTMTYHEYEKGNKIMKADEVYVSSRLEFQPEYGVSQIDLSSAVREYVDSFLRQNSKLVRVRSVGHTRELMMAELKSFKDIQSLIKEPHKVFDPLYAVLTKLVDMPLGRYLLRHTHRLGTFAEALVEHDQCGSSFSLRDHCQECLPLDVNVPPVLIDPFTLTAIHYFHHQPPAVLTPRPIHKGVHFKKPVRSERRNKRQQKRKKSKQKEVKAGSVE